MTTNRVNRRARTIAFLASFVSVAIIGSITTAAGATTVPVLWGVDEDDGQLFSIGDYTNPAATLTDYGRLRYWKGSSLRSISDIEAFAIDAAGVAYMAVNHDLGPIDEPVLIKFDLNTASTTSTNIVTVIGRMEVPFNSSSDNISGLGFHPFTGDMYGLFKDEPKKVDRLLIIDPSDAGVTQVGLIQGIGEKVCSGEELEFDQAGNLYVSDNADDELYRVDPNNGAILSVVDSDESDGLGHSSVKIEGLAWDPINSRMISFDDNYNIFAELTLTDGNNVPLGSICGLTDVEGIDFVTVIVPEPASMALLVVGGLALIARRRRHRA